MPILDTSSSRPPEQNQVVALVPVWDAGEEVRELPESGQLTVGTDRAADIRIRMTGVAPRHCQIKCVNGEITIAPTDGNEVVLNRRVLEQPEPAGAGDLIQFGAAEFRLESRRRAGVRRFHGNTQRPRRSFTRRSIAAAGPSNLEASALLSAGSQSLPDAALERSGFQEQRREVLDTRETRLVDLQAQLEERSVELDLRADRLALQQTQLLTRQRQLEKRRAALEERRAEEFEQWAEREEELRKASTEELTSAKKIVEKLTLALRTQKQEHEQKKQSLLDTTDKLEAKQHELTSLRQQLENAHREDESTRSNSQATIDELNRRLENVLQEHDADRETWRRKTAELTTSLNALSTQENGLDQARTAFEQTKLEHLNRIQEARVDIASREAALKEKLAEAEAQRRIEEQSAQEISKWREELEAERRQLQTDRENQEEELAAVRQELQTLKAELAEREQRVLQSEQEEQEREDALASREEHLEEFNARIEETSRAVEEQSQELQKLQESFRQQSAQYESDKAQADSEQEAVAAELHARAEQLSVWEAELNSRHDDLGEQVQRLKQEVTEEASPSVSASHQFAEELEQERRRNDELTKERDELTTALTELRTAFDSVRDELVSRNEKDAELTEEIKSLRATLDDKQDQLQETADALKNQQQEAEEFRQQLNELTDRFETEQKDLRAQLEEAQVAPTPIDSESEEVSQLLQEVESLREELAESRTTDASDDALAQVNDYESQIAELRRQLEDADTQKVSDSTDTGNEEYLEIIAQLKERVEDLQAQLSSAGEGSAATADPDVQIRERELDERTVVLDNREEEIRERQRMVENTENELEEQRRGLLEARQQLELARAEIQVAMDPGPAEPPALTEDLSDPAVDNSLLSAFENEPVEEEPAEEESQPAVRSEIAELFGLGGDNRLDEVTAVDESRPAVDEYSQEESAEVSMSFEQSEQLLLAPQEAEPESPAEEESSDEDSMISNYMEQLLARNRKGAGESLPEELKKEEKPKESKPAEAKQSAPGQTSFIEAYMSGQYSDDGSKVSEPETAGQAADIPPSKPEPPRTRIDLETLRNDMDSFRQLSTKSVENALATHAKRQERGGLAARTTVCTVLILVCVFVVGAALMDIIPFGTMVWLSIVVALGASAELGYRLWGLQQKVQSATDLVSGGAVSKTKPAAASSLEQLADETPTGESDATAEAPSVVAPDPAEAQPDTAAAEPESEVLTSSDLINDEARPSSNPDVASNGDGGNATVPASLSVESILESATGGEAPAESFANDVPDSSAAAMNAQSMSEPQAQQKAPPPEDGGASMGRSQIEDLLAEITGGDPTQEN